MIDKNRLLHYGAIALPSLFAVFAGLGLATWGGLSGPAMAAAGVAVALVLIPVFAYAAQIWLNAQIRCVASTLEGFGEDGRLDVSQRLDEPDNPQLARLVRAYNHLAQGIQEMVQAFTKTSTELGIMSSQIAEITERTQREILRQQHETDQVATAMNEMSATVEEVARHAANAAEAAHTADTAANEGAQIAEETRAGIEALVGEVDRAAEVIKKLDEESNNIGMVLDVIKNIAEQTNLLALNAAIEAARAGEQGRGFAVVADEVRTLASRTQQSTQEIEEMITRLQAGANESVKVMGSALEKGHEGARRVERTAEALADILGAVQAINEMNTQIATAAEEQSAVANEINRNIANISEVAHHTTQGAEEARHAGEQLASLSMELQQLVKKYELGAGSTLDLSAAKAAHLAWKARLRAFLDGEESLTEEQAVSHKHCDFGKWYYGVGLGKYGHIQALKELEAPHEELHKLIREIIRLKNAGDLEAAEEGYRQVDHLSQRIVSLIDQVEQAVNSGA